MGCLGTNFFGHTKFEFKNLSQFFHLQSTLDSELFRGGGSAHKLFSFMLNLRSKNFHNFFFYRVVWTVNFSEVVSGHQLFLVTLNLR